MRRTILCRCVNLWIAQRPCFVVSRLDYVFFETSSTTPYQIRRIEELNKVCFFGKFGLYIRNFVALAGRFSELVRQRSGALSIIVLLIGVNMATAYAIVVICRLRMAMLKRKLCAFTVDATSRSISSDLQINIKVSCHDFCFEIG